LEREMGFRTEMGLYFSYYKTVVEAPSFTSGLNQLLNNNVTEYPDTINVLKRFNLYPEVLLGGMHRVYVGIADRFKWEAKSCWRIERGEGLEPIWSCEGLGDLAYFYLEGVWLSAAVVAIMIFVLGSNISKSYFGGLLAVLGFLYNHGECTRVQWTPPLRESFAYPMSLIQMFALSKLLESKNENPAVVKKLALVLSTATYIILWQFAQFALFTQWFAVLILYSFQVITENLTKSILNCTLIGLGIAVIMMFGNEMLFTSWLFCCLLASAFVIYFLRPLILDKLNCANRLLRGVLKLTCICLLTVFDKQVIAKILAIQDDAHVANILRSKFTSYKDFHTLLYTCAKEFDFLGWEMPLKTAQTLLLPAAILGVSLVCLKAIRPFFGGDALAWDYHLSKEEEEDDDDDEVFERPSTMFEHVEPVVAYHVLQTVAFGFLAIIIMRLKLFFTPQLCILAALLCSKKYIPVMKSNIAFYSLLALLVAGMSVQGVKNIQHQRSILGEYSNYEMEELIEWIKASLPEKEGEEVVRGSMAGPMPVMANLLLSTGYPVANHPHYEDVRLRERTRDIYRMYSRTSADDYHAVLKRMQVKYLVVVSHWCFGSVTNSGCGMTDIWDIEEGVASKERGGRSLPPPLCPSLFGSRTSPKLTPHPKPFKRLFKNQDYVVLRVN